MNVNNKFGTVAVDMVDIIPDRTLRNKNDLSRLKNLILKDNIVVLTTGCFDLLHVGHVESLNKAKEMGDYLIVALNSDISVRQNKGTNRPIIPLEHRARMLLALTSVDFVAIFDEKVPHWIVEILDADIFLKGSEYTEDQIRKDYPSLKKVCLIPHATVSSTTSIIDRIKNM